MAEVGIKSAEGGAFVAARLLKGDQADRGIVSKQSFCVLYMPLC